MYEIRMNVPQGGLMRLSERGPKALAKARAEAAKLRARLPKVPMYLWSSRQYKKTGSGFVEQI